MIGPLKKVLQNVFRMESSHQTRDLDCFADSSNIPWNLPTIFHPDLITTVPQTYFTLRTALSAISFVCDLCGVDVQWFQERSSQDLPTLGICLCKWLLVSSLVPGTLASSFRFPEKFLFCTATTRSIEWPCPAPRLHIGDCFEIHILHWQFCDRL